MNKCALITIGSNEKEKNSGNNKLTTLKLYLKKKMSFKGFDYKTININDDDVDVLMITVLNNRKIKLNILKAVNWCIENGFELLAFDDHLEDMYKDYIKELTTKIHVIEKNDLKLSIYIKVIKKVLKANGVRLSGSSIAYIPGSLSAFEYDLVKFLIESSKYFICIQNGETQSKFRRYLEDIGNENGQSIMFLDNLDSYFEEVNVIADFDGDFKYEDNILSKCNLIIGEEDKNEKSNNYLYSTINRIRINIDSKLRINKDVSVNSIYKLCQMYLTFKTNNISDEKSHQNRTYELFASQGFYIEEVVGK